MTLDERLAAAGLIADFLEAMRRRDVVRLQEVLTAVRLDPATIETLLDRPFEPDWTVRVEIARRFQAGDWREATRVEDPSRALDRANYPSQVTFDREGVLTAIACNPPPVP